MKVFISWSGKESHVVASVLRDKLPIIINAIKPFVSSEDISKGSPWFQNIASELEDSAFGIVCLTRKNIQNQWILFEAGALAGKLTKKRVAPLLLDLKAGEVEPPLGQLQSTALEREDFLKLVLTLNAELPKERALAEGTLKDSFEMWWKPFFEKIQEKLKALPSTPPPRPERTEKEILYEILSLTRSIASNQPKDPVMNDNDTEALRSLLTNNHLKGKRLTLEEGKTLFSRMREAIAEGEKVTPLETNDYTTRL